MKRYRGIDFKSGKRDRLEIVSAIIAVAQQPSNFTRLMGQANLSYSLLKEYLIFMTRRGLVREHDVARRSDRKLLVYQATEKGNKFLELYCENLILLHGEHFLEYSDSLADAYLLQYCRKNRLTLGTKMRKSLTKEIKEASEN